MCACMSALALRRSSSCSIMYSVSGNLWQRYAGLPTCRSFNSSTVGSRTSKGHTLSFALSKQKRNFQPSTAVTSANSTGYQFCVGLSTRSRRVRLRLSVPTHERVSRVTWNVRDIPWRVGGACAALCLSFSTSGPVHAEAANKDNKECNASSISCSHGKKVYTDYSVTGIPGDGRCLFRSVVSGACIRSGKPLPNENLQRELADELRALVADEFVKRRSETEWFVEGDFDAYVSQIRKPHIWGGEPELFMASHVLRMPITVYMLDDNAGGLIAIAEYGQEYGKEDPIRVLYHGFGHYDALQIPGRQRSNSRL